MGSSVPASSMDGANAVVANPPRTMPYAADASSNMSGTELMPGCLMLGQVLENHGQAVPAALANIPLKAKTPPASVPTVPSGPDQATLQKIATQSGGTVRGAVPLSFLSNPTNPHAAWLIPPGIQSVHK